MAELGLVANVIAVVELSTKIASSCYQYSRDVKDAKVDIERFEREIERVSKLLRNVQALLEGAGKTSLSTSDELKNALAECKMELQQLNALLNPGKGRTVMRKFGLRALKWPFKSREVDKAITSLGRSRATISDALQVDQTAQIRDMHKKIDLTKLRRAEGAAFDSHHNEHEPRCHPRTRIGLLSEITAWAENEESTCIFWLNGMAGTGKSTVSRTVAQFFAGKDQLGASFFFKRGESDRGNASMFFTTIARQLTTKVPNMTPFIREAIDVDPDISDKSLMEQFKKLILQPLSKVPSLAPESRTTVLLVVDALDECEREDDIETILGLLSQFSNVASVCLRLFVTSRPDLPIRLGFQTMHQAIYRNLALHDVSEETIKHDICEFLQTEFEKMRLRRSINTDWPGQVIIDALVDMASPLFIFAATVCRFVGDPRFTPKDRLAIILDYQTTSWASKIDAMYLPILGQLFVGLDPVEKQELVTRFRQIVGTIVILASPLSVASLANLLGLEESQVTCILDSLHSVLSIPTDQTPIRLLHLSFRDFLLDERKKDNSDNSLFWVDEKNTHGKIASECLRLMSKPNCLKKDICGCRKPGTLRSQISNRVIDTSLQAEVKYACSYWVYHLEHSSSRLEDNGSVHIFLKQHLLHWLESMSMLQRTSESITMIISLLRFCEAGRCPNLHAFLDDARRFTLYNRSLIEQAPLQIYCSALVFVPINSIIRRNFESDVPTWIQLKPRVQADWDAARQTLEGHSRAVTSVAFSPDGKLVASASYDKTVRLWDAATGAARQTLEGQSRAVTSVAFSPDGKVVASASHYETVRLWDAATGAARQMLEGHSGTVTSVAFSPDGKVVASASHDETVRLWDAATGAARQTLEGHSDWVTSVAFSNSGQYLKTDRGSLRINPTHTSSSNDRDTADGFSVAEEWITKNEMGVLWLPPDYRAARVAVSEAVVVLGQRSGRVSTFQFAPGSGLVL